MRRLTVDPGMNTGWAMWDGQDLLTYGQITIKKKTVADDLSQLVYQFRRVLLDNDPEEVAIEWPALWAGSYTSMAAAASGDLMKLGALTGALAGTAALMTDVPPRLLSPQDWKGQLNKDAVKMRVERALGITLDSTHINDAIGIGLHLLGRFAERNPDIKAFANAPKPKMYAVSARRKQREKG